MTVLTVLTMILICGVVWGGFAALMVRALWSESKKPASSEPHGEGA